MCRVFATWEISLYLALGTPTKLKLAHYFFVLSSCAPSFEPLSPIQAAIVSGNFCGAAPVVNHGDVLNLPAMAQAGEDGVAGVRAAGLHGVGYRMIVGECLQSNASRIHNHLPFRQHYASRDVAMAAQNQRVRNSAQQGENLFR